MAKFEYVSEADKHNDIEILNRALFFENRAVWAYGFAADKLSTSDVGRAVLALGLENRSDHQKHQDLMGSALVGLGGTPVKMENQYDVSSYVKMGQGNLESDVNIAKLALALEIGAAAGYISHTLKSKSPELIELEAGTACVVAIHAGRIRAAFNTLGIKVPVVPNPVM